MPLYLILAVALLIVFLVTSSVRYFYSRFFSRGQLPASLPWIGVDNNKNFSRARATLRSFLHTRELVFEGYEKVRCSCAGKTVAIDLVAVLKEWPPFRPPQYQHWSGSHHTHGPNGMAT
jgi:hypothetical protein